MTHQTPKPNETHIQSLKDSAKSIGRDNGISAAQYCDKYPLGIIITREDLIPSYKSNIDNIGLEVDSDTWLDLNTSLAYESEENSRQYSPFEYTAQCFNNPSDENDDEYPPEIKEWLSGEIWEAYREGVSEGIEETLAAFLVKELKAYNLENGEPHQ